LSLSTSKIDNTFLFLHLTIIIYGNGDVEKGKNVEVVSNGSQIHVQLHGSSCTNASIQPFLPLYKILVTSTVSNVDVVTDVAGCVKLTLSHGDAQVVPPYLG